LELSEDSECTRYPGRLVTEVVKKKINQ